MRANLRMVKWMELSKKSHQIGMAKFLAKNSDTAWNFEYSIVHHVKALLQKGCGGVPLVHAMAEESARQHTLQTTPRMSLTG